MAKMTDWVSSSGVTRVVTLGAATEGVTPLFVPEKPGDLFSLIAVTITIAFYCSLSLGCHPTPFLPVRPRFSTIFL